MWISRLLTGVRLSPEPKAMRPLSVRCLVSSHLLQRHICLVSKHSSPLPVAVVEQATERLCKNPSTGVDSPAKELLAFGLRIMLSHHCLFQLRKKIHIVITFPMDCAREHGAGACHHSVLLCWRDVGRGGGIQFVQQQVSVSGRWQITLTDCNQM